MPVDKLTIEQFAKKVKAKYPAYKDVNDSVLVDKMIAKYPQYKDKINYSAPDQTQQFKPMSDWLSIPTGYQPMVAENAIIGVDGHEEKVSKAKQRVNDHLYDIDKSVHDLIYNKKKELQGRIVSEQLGLNPREIGPVNLEAQQLEARLRQDVPVTPQEIEGFKSDMGSNQVMTRQALNQKAVNLSKTDPLAEKQLKADIYRLDRQANPEKESKVDQNIDKIKNGEYDYDIVNGQIVNPQGFFGSLVTGYKEKVQAFDDAGIYESGDKEAMLDRIKERLKFDPDKAIPVPEKSWLGLAEIGRMTGGQPLKPLIGGGVIGLLLGPEAAAVTTSLASVPEMYRLTLGSALPNNYDAIKRQEPNLPEDEALQRALDLTHKQAAIDAVSGAAMGALGAKIGFAPTGLKTGLLQKSLGSALKQIGQEGVKKTIEGLGVGSVGAAGQYVKNIMARNAGIPTDTSQGLAEQLWGGVGMTMTMTLIAKAPDLLKPKTYRQLLQSIKDVPTEDIVSNLNELEQSGEITPEQSKSAQEAIEAHKTLDNSIKPNVPESDRIKVQELIGKRNDLEASLETEDKAYHAETKEKIKSLEEQINNVSKGSERGELQKLVDAEDKAGNLKDFTSQTLRDASENDLKGYMKEIADQAHAGNEENAIQSFGEGIVNKAKELYPKVEKETRVSVIKPGDIKQPTEIITIKPEENAIPIRSAEAVPLDETSRGGQPMGEGVSEPAKTANAQEGGAAQEGVPPGQEGIVEPPIGVPGSGSVYAERPAGQLSFRGLQDTANEFGFEDVRSRDPKTDLQTRRNAERTANEWAANGEYQKNIDEIIGKVERREMVPTDEQRFILEEYIENEKQKARDIADKSSEEYNRQLAKVRRIKEIGNTARSEAGAALRIPEGGSRVHPINDEIDAMVAKMEANKVDQLTDQQKAEVEAQVEKYKQANDEANTRIAQLEDQVAKVDANKEFNKVKSTTKRTKKTVEERIAYRKSEIEAAREALKKLRTGESGLSTVPLPGVRELMAIAPHVKNIMVDLVAQGVDNLQDVIKHLHGEFKDVLDGITEKNIHDIIAGEYNEKSKLLSELQAQLRDIRDEAKYINQYEALVNGKEPKNERAKVERNRKIKEIKGKIKSLKKDIKDSEKFYGESDAPEEKLNKLRNELERIQNRKQKEQPVKGSQADREISAAEKELRDRIDKAQAEWDSEIESGRQRDRDYARMETERNRQLERVNELKEKLENLQKGVKAKGKANAKKVDTPEIEALKKQIVDAESDLNKTIATEKRVKAMEEELDRLKSRREKEPKEVDKRELTEREKELKEQIAEERKAFKKEKSEAEGFYKEELDDDAKKLIAIKKRNQKLEQQIKDKIAKGEFEKEKNVSIFDREDIKKSYPRLRKDALDAIAAKEDAQHEFDLALYNDEMNRRSFWQKAAGLGGKLIHTSKAVLSGIDDSATFVQNGLAMMANPKTGAKVWLEHWKDAFNDARFKREITALHQRPDWEIIEKSGLDVVEPHSAASKQVEEAFEQNLLAGKFKIGAKEYQPWKYTGGIFERAFTSMGNNFRVALFEKRMKMLLDEGKTFESHPEEYKAAARAINDLTGRGKLPLPIAQASPWLTPIIWAPRLLASTLNTLGLSDVGFSLIGKGEKGYYRSLTPAQRKFALAQLGQGVAMGVGIMGAASLAGAKVDYDPRSVTFGDIIVGDHHFNVFGRYVPVIKTIVQAGLGTRIKGDGSEQDLDSGKFGAKTRGDVVGGFFRGKMTPAAGVAYDLSQGRNYYTGEPMTVKDLPEALVQPMSIKELREGWKNDGTETILNRFLPAFEGIKTSDERDFEKKNSSSGSSTHKKSGHKKTHVSHKHN